MDSPGSVSPSAAGSVGSNASRWILHLDLDQFIAAVEVIRRPELQGRPVVVGGSGDPTQRRAVVATASYEARAFGIRSGMPLRSAARRCPDAVFLPHDPAAYEAASAHVMATLRTFPVVVETAGWDEAFIDAGTGDPEALARDMQRAIKSKTGLSCSVGIGDNKHRAKIATRFAKPGGIDRLTAADWMSVMGERPTAALWGIGRRLERRLGDQGIFTVAQLAAADPVELARAFGPTMGPWYRQLALGHGSTTVSDAPWVPRSRSREMTFPVDLTSGTEIQQRVAELARELARDAEESGRCVARVAVKVRFSPFFTRIRSATLREPTDGGDDVERAALAVLERFDDRRPVRLLGVRVEYEAPTDRLARDRSGRASRPQMRSARDRRG
jgi:DNA polymerase-4